MKKSPDQPKSETEPLVDARQQAGWFNRVRKAHQTETAEDYVELIADLIDAQGEARVVDLASRLGVSHVTVNKVIARLNREGLVTNLPYRSLFLTSKGKAMAIRCKERHKIVLQFLLALGIAPATAEADAEGVEHHVSEETLEAFQKFISETKPR